MFSKEKIIFIDQSINSKSELFKIISEKAVALGVSDNEEALVQGFEDREAQGSTGFQDGLGIPHCKTNAVKVPSALFIRANQPIEWDTFDGKPLTDMFALLIPEDGATEHLQVLTKISRKLMDKEFRANIKSSNTADELMRYLEEIK